MMTTEKNPYADILHLPHHQAADRPHMSMLNRAAQFSPYAALVGFDDVIAETGRLTDQKAELSEAETELLDQKLTLIDGAVRAGRHPAVSVTYFVSDPRKQGGSYETYMGNVRNIDTARRTVVFLSENGCARGKVIRIDDITAIHGEPVDPLDDFV